MQVGAITTVPLAARLGPFYTLSYGRRYNRLAKDTTMLDRYKRVDYPLPDTTWVWQLDDKGFDHLQIVEMDRPRPGPDEIAFRVDCNCHCFSDVKIVMAGREHPRLVDYDLKNKKTVVGHEASITITEVGSNVGDRFAPGRRYIVQADMLKYHSAVGYNYWGGLRQFGVWPPEVQEYLIPLDKDLGYSQAALVEPWACVEASYTRVDFESMDQRVWMVGGAGPMGQMHLSRALVKKQVGQAPNMKLMVITDISTPRLNDVIERFRPTAEEVGVELVGLNPTETDLDVELERVAPGGFDHVVALVSVPAVVDQARAHVRQYGVLNLFAGIKRGQGPLNMGDIHYDQITLTGNSGSRMRDMLEVLHQVEDDVLDTNVSAGAITGIKAAKEGLEGVRDARFDRKVIVYPQLTDLPLMAVEQTVRVVQFDPDTRRQVESGRWTCQAEAQLLEQLGPVRD